MNGTTGYVYFVHDPNRQLIKIGWSQTPFVRLGVFRREYGDAVSLLGCVEGTLQSEKEFHRAFDYMLFDGEWFHDTEAIREFIAKKCHVDLQEVKQETVRLRLYPSTMARLRKIAVREHITLTQVLQRACEQTADQGCTDTILIKGRI